MDLISIVNVGCEAEAAYERLATGPDEEVEARQSDLDRLFAESVDATRSATAIPALSDQEVIAKARLLAALTRQTDDDDPTYRLAQSLLRDLQLQQANVAA